MEDPMEEERQEQNCVDLLSSGEAGVKFSRALGQGLQRVRACGFTAGLREGLQGV